MPTCIDCHDSWLSRAFCMTSRSHSYKKIKMKYSHFRKRDHSHLAATCKHSPYTRKKNRSYAQRTVEIEVILFFHYLILIIITDSCLVLFRRQKRQQPRTERPQCVSEWSSTHWSHCSQGVLRASLMPLGTGSSLGCYFITPPYIPTGRGPKILPSLAKKGSKNNIARRTYFMESRISVLKERNSNKCLIT